MCSDPDVRHWECAGCGHDQCTANDVSPREEVLCADCADLADGLSGWGESA